MRVIQAVADARDTENQVQLTSEHIWKHRFVHSISGTQRKEGNSKFLSSFMNFEGRRLVLLDPISLPRNPNSFLPPPPYRRDPRKLMVFNPMGLCSLCSTGPHPGFRFGTSDFDESHFGGHTRHRLSRDFRGW
jgi:hypothetical protein